MDIIQEQSLKWEDLPFKENKLIKTRVKIQGKHYQLFTKLECINLDENSKDIFVDGISEYSRETVFISTGHTTICEFNIVKLDFQHNQDTKFFFENLKIEPVKLSDEDLYIYDAININKL